MLGKKIKGLAMFLSFIFLFSAVNEEAFAQGTSGLANPLFGAAALAQGNAFVARADNASAVHFNPAGLIQLSKPQFSLGATSVLPLVDYHGPTGKETMRRKVVTLPNAYFTSPIIDGKLAVGIGVTVPFGLSGKWSKTGSLRYVTTEFKLRVINVNPSFAFKPFSFLSIGAGLDYYHASAHREKRVNVGLINSILTGLPIVPGTPDGTQKLEEHSDGFGYNVGLLLNITERHSIGASFRSKAVLHVNGKLKLSNLSGPTAAVFGASDTFVRTRTTAELPEMLSVGYAYRHGDLWSIEADFQWTNWSRYDVLTYGFRPTNALLEADNKQVNDWHNTVSFALGGEYKVIDALKVRGGYTFHETPVPSKTFEPTVPQSSRHALFTGLGYSWGGSSNSPEESDSIEKTIDVAYGAVFYEDRHINNTVGNSVGATVDGRYDLMTHMVAISFSLSF